MNTVQRRESRQSTAMRYINDFEKISDKKKEFSNMKARVEELKILQLREQGKKIEMVRFS